MLYLDTSAAVKLVRREAESDALAAFVAASSGPVATSRAGIIELRRIARRSGAVIDRADALAASLTVIELDGLAAGRAVTVESGLGALDAIHLGSALVCRPVLRAFVCYDARLAEAARAAGLPVVAPGTSSARAYTLGHDAHDRHRAALGDGSRHLQLHARPARAGAVP